VETGSKLDPCPVSVRVKIAGLWAAMLLTFAYVDLFGLYRADVRAKLDAGQIGGFTISQVFLAVTTIYVVIPALALVATLILAPQVSRNANLALALIYAVTIIGSALGEWGYYVIGSAIEVCLLAGIVYYAWTWPRQSQHTQAPND